jgi:hypothetical protein
MSAGIASVLVVAHKTAATPALIEAVRERARRRPARFHLLVPSPVAAEWHPLHPRRHELLDGEIVLALALPLLSEATGAPVEGSVSVRHDPMDAIEDALAGGGYDEIILSTLPPRVSRWLRIDLPRRVEHLGLPLTTVIARQRAAAGAG